MNTKSYPPRTREPHGLVIGLLAAACPRWSESEKCEHGTPLIDLSLEQLCEVEITSVAKKRQHLFEAPAGGGVITSDDIRRSGVTSVPEALRVAPGVEVARIAHNKWAIYASVRLRV